MFIWFQKIADKLGDTAEAVLRVTRILDRCVPDEYLDEAHKLGGLIEKQLAAHADDVEQVADALADIAKNVDADDVGDTFRTLMRLLDKEGRNLDAVPADKIDEFGQSIARLHKSARTPEVNLHGIDIDVDLLGMKTADGTRVPGKGFLDEDLLSGLTAMGKLDDAALDGFYRFLSKADADSAKALKAATKLLQLDNIEDVCTLFAKVKDFTDGYADDAIRSLFNLVDNHNMPASVADLGRTFDADVLERAFKQMLLIDAQRIPAPLTDDGVKAVPKILAKYKEAGELAIGDTNVAGMMDIMYGRTGLDVNDCLEVFGSVTDCNGFRGWIATAGNSESFFKGKYFEALYARDHVGVANVDTIRDVVDGQDAIDIITLAEEYIECKNREDVLTATGELIPEIRTQIGTHFARYREQNYRWVFSKGFEGQEPTIRAKIIEAFEAEGWDPGREVTVVVQFIGNNSPVPF